jgi:hypothetical protein
MTFKEKVPIGHVSVEIYGAQYGISKRTIRRRIENGEIKARKGRWRWFISMNGKGEK